MLALVLVFVVNYFTHSNTTSVSPKTVTALPLRTDTIPFPFLPKSSQKSTLSASLNLIGQNDLSIPIYKVGFDDVQAQGLDQDVLYMVYMPAGVPHMPFDAMVRAINGGKPQEYFGYEYTPNAQSEQDNRDDPNYSVRFPGSFFVSQKGMDNARLKNDIQNFQTTNQIQFKIAGARNDDNNGILLENRIYAIVMNEPNGMRLSIQPPPLCGDDWKDDSEQCDDGNLDNGDGCDYLCHVEDSYVCSGNPSVCGPSTSICRGTANGFSVESAMSGNGRYIAFSSSATNLLNQPTTNGVVDIYLYDRQTRQTFGITPPDANGASGHPSISSDGKYIVFQSTASNLVVGDHNNVSDVFLFNTQDASIKRISGKIEPDGASVEPFINRNGTFVTFASKANNIVLSTGGKNNIYVYSIATGDITLESLKPNGTVSTNDNTTPSISNDGRYVTFVSVGTVGLDGNHPRTSGQDVYVRDRQTAITQTLTAGANNESGGVSRAPIISADGNYIAFASQQGNLVPQITTSGQQYAYLYQRQTGQRQLVSMSTNNAIANNSSLPNDISPDGRFVIFDSIASNLVSPDTNGNFDVFLRDTVTHETARISLDLGESESARYSTYGTISDDATLVTFFSPAPAPSFGNIFTRDIPAKKTYLMGESVECRCMNGDCMTN